MPRKWSITQLDEAVNSSISIAQVLRKLGLREAGGNYATINRLIKEMDIDISHWQGQGWSKGLKRFDIPSRDLAEILVENSVGSNSHLKTRLLRENILSNICALCGLTEWLSQPISLHLDHVNGKRNDNRIENLRLLCPNCHSQTITYCGRNIGKASY